jgi:hypothetical protein
MTQPLSEDDEKCAVCGESIEGLGDDRLDPVTHQTWTCGLKARMHSECWEALASVNHSRQCRWRSAIDPPVSADDGSANAAEVTAEYCPICSYGIDADARDDTVVSTPHDDGDCPYRIHLSCWPDLKDGVRRARCFCGRDVALIRVEHVPPYIRPSDNRCCPVCPARLEPDGELDLIAIEHAGQECGHLMHARCWEVLLSVPGGISCGCGRALGPTRGRPWTRGAHDDDSDAETSDEES